MKATQQCMSLRRCISGLVLTLMAGIEASVTKAAIPGVAWWAHQAA